jgi:hypothetical protein
MVAVGIVVLLVVLVLPALRTLKCHDRKMAARDEVRDIGRAWEKYLSEYKQWPTNTKDGVYALTGNLARILSGENAWSNNPAKTVFMTFSRMNAATNPISPWAESNAYYYCRFDHDYDQIIMAGGVTNSYPAIPLRCRVVVWATNLDVRSDASNCIVGSWLE